MRLLHCRYANKVASQFITYCKTSNVHTYLHLAPYTDLERLKCRPHDRVFCCFANEDYIGIAVRLNTFLL